MSNSEKTKIAFRTTKTETRLRAISEKSLQIMLDKNKQRSDCWRYNGLEGQFIDIHAMYFRLRNLIWEIGPPLSLSGPEHREWVDAVVNALQDMRNYTMLAEISVLEDNIKGEEYPIDDLRKLKDKKDSTVC